MRLIKTLILTVFISQMFGILNAQAPMVEKFDLPKVFIIGEHEEEFNNLTLSYQTLLLTACDENMDMAYNKWLSMLQELEAFSEISNFDLKGTKMWINVFWEKDGTISHIAYHLKPQSKNIDTRFLTAFLAEFAKNYRFPLVHVDKYSHYGTANFPVYPKRIKSNTDSTSGSLQNQDDKQLVKDKH